MQDIKIPKSEKKLRVLMIAPQPWFQPRGTPFSVLHRIKAMSLLGHNIDLATYHIGEDIPIENLHIHRAARIPFIKNVKIGPSLKKILLDIFLYFKARSLLKKNQYDLLHTHEEASFFGVNLAKKYNLPHLYDMHSSLPQQLDNFKYPGAKVFKKIFSKLETRTIQSASAIITICPELQKYVSDNYPHKTSILIENVADNSIVFPPDQSQEKVLRKQYNLNGQRLVLYYGTLEPYQGIDLLIESSAELIKDTGENIHFLLVGGSPDQVRRYQQVVSEHNVDDYFTFTGFVRPQLIPGFISMADVLVSPRLKGTNSPLKIYSYLRSGKPIVATRHITHTQILDDSVAMLVDPKPEEFARGIQRVLESETLRARLVDNAQQLAESRYSYSDYLKKTEWILQQAVQARP